MGRHRSFLLDALTGHSQTSSWSVTLEPPTPWLPGSAWPSLGDRALLKQSSKPFQQRFLSFLGKSVVSGYAFGHWQRRMRR